MKGDTISRNAILNNSMLHTMKKKDVLDLIRNAPTVEPPVVHGRWEIRNDGSYGRARAYCTACGKHSGIGGIRSNQLKSYCPNCGARMDGDERE